MKLLNVFYKCPRRDLNSGRHRSPTADFSAVSNCGFLRDYPKSVDFIKMRDCIEMLDLYSHRDLITSLIEFERVVSLASRLRGPVLAAEV